MRAARNLGRFMHPRYSVSEQVVASRARALFSRLHSPLSDR
jgi:hypothetical protein